LKKCMLREVVLGWVAERKGDSKKGDIIQAEIQSMRRNSRQN
jgi:hypothetical protein